MHEGQICTKTFSQERLILHDDTFARVNLFLTININPNLPSVGSFFII